MLSEKIGLLINGLNTEEKRFLIKKLAETLENENQLNKRHQDKKSLDEKIAQKCDSLHTKEWSDYQTYSHYTKSKHQYFPETNQLLICIFIEKIKLCKFVVYHFLSSDLERYERMCINGNEQTINIARILFSEDENE